MDELEKRRIAQRVREGTTITRMPAQKNLADAKEAMQVLLGTRGNPLDRAVSHRELEAALATGVSTSTTTPVTPDLFALISGVVAASGHLKFKVDTKELIIQWGSFTSTTDDWQVVPFPTPFVTACYCVVPSLPLGYGIAVTATDFSVNRLNEFDTLTQIIFWVAIGE